MRHDEDARRLGIDERDRSVFHFRGRVAFRVDVADFLELERPFERSREIKLPTKVEKRPAMGVFFRDASHDGVALECRVHLLGQRLKLFDNLRALYGT